MPRGNRKILAVFLLMVFLAHAVFSQENVPEDIQSMYDALDENNLLLAAGYAMRSVFGAAENLRLVWWFSMLLGIIMMALIALKLSKMLNAPAPDRKKIRKEREDAEFAEIIRSREDSLEQLKNRLFPQEKKK